jgi:hypothetical protein
MAKFISSLVSYVAIFSTTSAACNNHIWYYGAHDTAVSCQIFDYQ